MRKVKIYTLSDPTTLEIRYIGKTVQTLQRRLDGHIMSAIRDRETSHKCNWIKQLYKNDLFPIIEAIEEIEETNWESIEQYWIAQFKAWNFTLLNMTDGGTGNKGQFYSEERRQKVKDSLKNFKHTEEAKRKISIGRTGIKLSEITKEKIRQINLGKKQSQETKAKRYKPVLKFSKQGDFIEEYLSLQHAALANNAHRGAIQNCCVGRAKTAGGFGWKYKNANELQDIV
jgi:group I intron endonuclease